MRRSYFAGGAGALGLLVLRLVVGAAFILHGWPKIYQNGQFYQNGQLVMTTWMNDVFKEKAPPLTPGPSPRRGAGRKSAPRILARPGRGRPAQTPPHRGG